MQVRELMNPAVVTVEPSSSAALAARLISRHNVGALPVCGGDGRLRGIVTDRDIVLRCVAAEEDPAQVPVRDIMTRNCATVSPGDDCREATARTAPGSISVSRGSIRQTPPTLPERRSAPSWRALRPMGAPC